MNGRGVTALEETEDPDVPDELMATALNVYAVPLVSPAIEQEVAGAVMEHVAPPG